MPHKVEIAIVILILTTFIWACSKDETIATDARDKNAPITEQVLHDSKINLFEKGRTTATIEAAYIEKRFGEQNTRAKNIKAHFFDSLGVETSWLIADSGEVIELTNLLEVWGKVEATSREGNKLYTSSLRWDQSKNRVVTDDYVEIHMGKSVIQGYGLETDRNLKNFTIKRQVSGQLEKLPGDST